MNSFKQLSLFLPNVGRKRFTELTQSHLIEIARSRLAEIISQDRMLGDEFFDDASELRISPGNREEVSLFSGKVILNLLLEVLLDFRLPGLQLLWTGQRSPIDAYAQREHMLMLTGEWD